MSNFFVQGRRGDPEERGKSLARRGRQGKASNLVTQVDRVQAEGIEQCDAGHKELKDGKVDLQKTL